MDLESSNLREIVRNQLAIDLNCSPDDFLKDEITYAVSQLNEGRRLFQRKSPPIEITTMGRGTIISADEKVIDDLKDRFKDSSKDEIFSSDIMIGHAHYFIPDIKNESQITISKDIVFEFLENDRIQSLYQYPGFNNALQYNKDAPRPDVIAMIAKIEDEIVGISAASADCKTMWQIGVDVLPKHRNNNIASYLVREQSKKILGKGIVPYYGTTSANIASQLVAYKTGFVPCWISSYINRYSA